jgi:hypothetical protein
MNAVFKIKYKKSAEKYFLIDLGLWIIKSHARNLESNALSSLH